MSKKKRTLTKWTFDFKGAHLAYTDASVGGAASGYNSPIITIGVVIVLSGLSMWKPVQLHWLVSLFGGYDIARYVHFTCMALIVAFLVIHVALALLVLAAFAGGIVWLARATADAT